MKIEIRSLKIARSLSEETTAYTADVYVDGVKTFAASNHGHGGCDMYHRYPTAKVDEAAVNAWLATNVAPDGPWEADPAQRAPYDTGHTCNLETFVGRFIEAAERETDRKRIAKKFDGMLSKSVAALRPDGAFVTFKAAPTTANLAAVRKAKPDFVVLNDADEATKRKGLLAYCPDYAALETATDHGEAMYERFREGRTTLADARYLLAENDRAAKPCADTRAHLLGIIATQEAAEQAYRDDRMQRAARDAAGALIGQVS